MLFIIALILIALSFIGGIISLVIGQPIAGIWSGIICHLGFVFLVIDGFIPKEGYTLKASQNHPQFGTSDVVLVLVFCIFFSFGFWGFFTARNELYSLTSNGKTFAVLSVIGWVVELLYCLWVLLDFVRSRLKRVAY